MTNDIELDIFTARSVTSKRWEAKKIRWADVVKWLDKPSDRKECGGYVFGRFRGHQRRGSELIDRCAIQLDFDTDANDVPANLEALGYQSLWHTTYSHAPDQFKCRVIIPLSRPAKPSEYEICAEALSQQLGIAAVDRTSWRPTQFMWKPSAQQRDWFQSGVIDGPLADPLDVMMSLDETLSEATRGPNRRQVRRKRDPLELPGVAGAFNRAYAGDLPGLIEAYDLPYVLVSEEAQRYCYAESTSSGGFGPIHDSPDLYFSNHASDPAGLQACSAFDLVRIHLFGEEDSAAKDGTPVNRLPSTALMNNYVVSGPHKDDRVIAELAKDQAAAVKADFGDTGLDPSLQELTGDTTMDDDGADDGTPVWVSKLDYDNNGVPRDTPKNIELLADNHPLLKPIRWSEMFEAPVSAELPWVDNTAGEERVVDTPDLVMIQHELAKARFELPINRVEAAVIIAAKRRRFNALSEMLSALPEWDGVERMETCLPGVEPTPFTRLAARRALVGAVARAMNPGVKMDLSLILCGDAGLGKTRWIQAMAMDPKFVAELGPINNKDTLITMNRSWIMISDEVEGLRKADSEALKSFLTKTHDNYRAPYAKSDTQRPRRCVIWGTTNDRHFLRRQAGNRRFLVVECVRHAEPEKLSASYVEQVWAEAIVAYKASERCWMTPEEEALADEERLRFTQEDSLVGQVADYLEMDVPMEWNVLPPSDRESWYSHGRFVHPEDGAAKQNVTCVAAIYREVMGMERNQMLDRDRSRIEDALSHALGWKFVGIRHVPGYGRQRAFEREKNDVPELDGFDLI